MKLGYQLAHDRAHLVLDRGAFVSPPYIRALTITDALGAATTFEDGTSHVLTPAGATELRLGTFNTFGNETLQVVFDHVFVRRYQ